MITEAILLPKNHIAGVACERISDEIDQLCFPLCMPDHCNQYHDAGHGVCSNGSAADKPGGTGSDPADPDGDLL